MAYALFDMNNLPHSRRIVRRFPSYADAVAHAKIYYDILVFSEDVNAAAPSAKFVTKGRRLYTINPI